MANYTQYVWQIIRKWVKTQPLRFLSKVSMGTLLQYIPRNMHTVFALLCFVVVIHWLIFPYPSGLLHWHCGNLTIAPVPAKQPWWIWINTSCKFIMNVCITTTKQSTTKPCAYFLGCTVSMQNTFSMLLDWICHGTLLITKCDKSQIATAGKPDLSQIVTVSICDGSKNNFSD